MSLSTGSDWWMSTKSPKAMFRPEYQDGKLEAYLREHTGIDSAILAEATGVGRIHIEACQRRLGLRKFAPTGRRRKKIQV